MEKISECSKRVRTELVSLIHLISECIPRIKSSRNNLGEQCPCARLSFGRSRCFFSLSTSTCALSTNHQQRFSAMAESMKGMNGRSRNLSQDLIKLAGFPIG